MQMKTFPSLLAALLVLTALGEVHLRSQSTNATPAIGPVATKSMGDRLDLKIQSKDRMFAGQIKISPAWKHTTLRFVNLTSGQDLGKYADVLETMTGSKPAFKIYEHQGDIYSSQDAADAKADPAVTQQAVVFFKDDQDRMLLHFASTFDDVGTLQVQVIQDGKPIAFDRAKLTSDPAFSSLIQTTDKAISAGGPAPATNSPGAH
jgi:hypothetical protein